MKKIIISFIVILFSVFIVEAQELIDVKAWTQDINQYRKTISKKHKDPFTRVSKDVFNESCYELIETLPELTNEEAQVQLCRIASMIGDAHTYIQMNARNIFPVSFYWFSDGLRVLAIENTHEELLGSRVLYINGVPAEKVVAMLSTIIPHENQSQLKSQIPNYLNNAEVLLGLGIITSKEACKYTFDIGSRAEPEVELASVPMSKMKKFRSRLAWSKPEKPVMANENPDKIYWFKVLEKQNTVYVQYKSCREMDDYSFAQFTDDVMKQIDQMDHPKLIIDLRGNGGGNSSIFSPMLKQVSKRFFLNQSDKLFVLVGRRTFSSAILNAMDLRNKTNATLIGESTGGKPNHFGEVKNGVLKNCGLKFTWSVKYFTVTDGDPESIFPDSEITVSYHDYKVGKDPVLEKIKTF